MKDFLRYVNLGVVMFSTAVVGLFSGTVIDRIFGTFPVYSMVLLLLGILSGIWSMYKTVRTLM